MRYFRHDATGEVFGYDAAQEALAEAVGSDEAYTEVTGEWPPPPPPPTLDDYRRAIEAHVEDVARARDYSSAVSCASYVSSTNAAWAAEAAAFVAWRDAVWAAVHAALAAWQGGGPAPSVAELMGSLPEMVWPQPD